MFNAISSTTCMLFGVGLAAALLFRVVRIDSWRLRQWLMFAVLLQGVMFVRSPLHLGLLPAKADSGNQFVGHFDEGLRTRSDVGDGSEVASRLAGSSFLTTPMNDEPSISFWSNLSSWPWRTIVGSIWAMVLGTLFFISAVRYLRLLKLVRRLPLADDRWQEQLDRAIEREAIKGGTVRMLVSPTVGPLLVRRPRGYVLIVPNRYWHALTTAQRQAVLVHELAHLRRSDVWRQLFVRVITSLHWFNPVGWWALRQYEEAAELACDQAVTRRGKHASASFASALVQLVDWHQGASDASVSHQTYATGVGYQAMATPPLTHRISRLLESSSNGDSLMKRLVLVGVAIVLVGASFFQVRLTTAQDAGANGSPDLQVIDDTMAAELKQLVARLDTTDASTGQLASLYDSVEGKLAIAGALNQLARAARDDARDDAFPRFIEAHFETTSGGKLKLRSQHAERADRWKTKSKRWAENMDKLRQTTDEIAEQLDTSSDVGVVFKRLLKDEQAPAALLLFEMEGGGDLITRFISEAMDRILVQRADGAFEIVQSRRREAEIQVTRFELAGKLAKRLQREIAVFAKELDTSDEEHQQLAKYMSNPMMATVVALHLTEDDKVRSASAAVDRLFGQLDSVSVEAPGGVRIENEEAWSKFREIFVHVDRATELVPKVQMRLAELAETLTTDDELLKRFETQLGELPVAVLISAELPYAESDPGAELKALLSEVLVESDSGKLGIVEDRQEEVVQKATELLRTCRAIRRHVSGVDDLLGKMENQSFVAEIGDAGRYFILGQVRDFADRYRPDLVQLLAKEILEETDDGQFRVRPDQREIVAKLIDQAEKVRAEAANDDF